MRRNPNMMSTAASIAFAPAVEFGPMRSLETISALADQLEKMDPSHEAIPGLLARTISTAIDHFFPVQNGSRKFSRSLDFERAKGHPDAHHDVMANLQLHIWMHPSDAQTLGHSNADLWHAIQFAEYVSIYDVDLPESLIAVIDETCENTDEPDFC